MARQCDLCKKGTVFGKQVSHSHHKTPRKWKVNLISLKALHEGSIKKMRICSRCLRGDKVKKFVSGKPSQSF